MLPVPLFLDTKRVAAAGANLKICISPVCFSIAFEPGTRLRSSKWNPRCQLEPTAAAVPRHAADEAMIRHARMAVSTLTHAGSELEALKAGRFGEAIVGAIIRTSVRA
jgi:hypothetical protein